MNAFKPLTHSNSEKSKRGSELGSLLHSTPIVEIETLVVGGDGLARIEFQQKQVVVFVPRSAPGDQLKIKITAAEKNHLLGEIIEIIKPSEARRQAPCVYYDKCGGCNWQHVTEDMQVSQKEKILTGLMQKFLPDVTYTLQPLVRSDKNFNYRNRIQLKQIGSQLGYFKRGSHDIVDIDACLIAEEEISKQITEVKKKLRPSQEVRKFELRLNHEEKFESYPIGQDGEGLSFAQVNRGVNDALVKTVKDMVLKIAPTVVTELYAGAGNFTFPLVAALPQALFEAVELNSKLTQFAALKISKQSLQKRLFFFTSDCESFTDRRSLSAELVLLDPPRAGCSEQVLKNISRANPRHLIYISCHPVHLARDLKFLMKLGDGYRIRHLQVFDMFPQTDHFETLVWLEKAESSLTV